MPAVVDEGTLIVMSDSDEETVGDAEEAVDDWTIVVVVVGATKAGDWEGSNTVGDAEETTDDWTIIVVTGSTKEAPLDIGGDWEGSNSAKDAEDADDGIIVAMGETPPVVDCEGNPSTEEHVREAGVVKDDCNIIVDWAGTKESPSVELTKLSPVVVGIWRVAVGKMNPDVGSAVAVDAAGKKLTFNVSVWGY